jgi:hypothetical protein
VVATGHCLLQRPQLVLEGDEVGRAGERVLAQRQAALQRRPLVVQGDPRSFREGELPGGDARLSGQHAEQRRLPGAVRAGEGDDIAALDAERDAVEEGSPGMLLA